MAVHGDIREITVNHPTLGSRSFFSKANEGNTYDQGGFRNSDDNSNIASNGDLIIQKNQVSGMLEALIENDMNVREDADFINQLAASPTQGTWTFQVVNGTVWQGRGVPVGDIQPDINAGTFTLKIVAGRFKKIVG